MTRNLHAQPATGQAARKAASAAFAGAALLTSSPGLAEEPQRSEERREDGRKPGGIFPNNFSVSFRSHVFPELADSSSGYTTDFGMLARISMGKSWGFAAGGSVNTLNLLGSMGRTKVSSGEFEAGAYYQRGKHTVFGLVSGGFTRLETVPGADGKSYFVADAPKAGLKAGYDYDRMFGAMVAVDASPFNPLSLTLTGRSPYGWVDEAKPGLSFELGWLRVPNGSADGFFDTASLSATLRVPIVKIGRFMPQSITIADGDISSGKPNVYFGGTIQTDVKDGFSFETGAAESIRGTILLILTLSG
ncbi:MAG TPA: hypothetical protein VLD37_07185 [Candidatus Bilamarchaeum sp.]|nr:hypothetical protein [Candidatus Bilamarchaeum sp.]